MQPLLSPEKYIRTKARQLPLGKCYITENWETSGIANIIVSREHTNGNYTLGVFLVDLYCLGVKDSIYNFNIPDFQLEDLINSMKEQGEEVIETSYTLVHNIIYGAVEFANDYEFKPHKSFELTQYILEEDTDDIEFMEIPLGIDDKPAIITTRKDRPVNVIAQLERVAGKGNYDIIYTDDEDDYDEGEFYNPDKLIKDYSLLSFDDLVEELKKEHEDPKESFGLAFEFYLRIFENEEETFHQVVENIQESENLIDIVTDYSIDELKIIPEDSALFYNVQKLVFDKDKKAVKACIDALEKAPHPTYYSLLVTAYQYQEQSDKANEIIIKAFELYPDNLLTRINYGFYLFEEKKLDQLSLFMSGFDISRIEPNRKTIHLTEISGIYHLACMYYVETDQMIKAMAYQFAYDMFEELTDALYEKKFTLFEYLSILQLEKCQEKIMEASRVN